MTCNCDIFSGDGGCLTHRLTMTERQREQCRSSKAFFDGFHYLGQPKKRPETPREYKPPQPKTTKADLPCVYRGETKGIVKCKPCQSSGLAGAETWACAIYGLCSINNVAVQAGEQKPVACITCDDRQPSIEQRSLHSPFQGSESGNAESRTSPEPL